MHKIQSEFETSEATLNFENLILKQKIDQKQAEFEKENDLV